MLSLMIVMLAAAPSSVMRVEPAPQAVSATLQSCAMEGGRWVCRYAVPDIEIVPLPNSDIVANAPTSVLSGAPSADMPMPTTVLVPAPGTTVVDPGPIVPIDAGVLTEREAGLVARCADAGWVSLCLPADRRSARALQEKQNIYLAVRREVTSLLGRDRCEAAVRAALDGGYLALARETRDYCAAPGGETSSAAEASKPAED